MAEQRPKLPAAVWIPINKSTLASWRSGPTEQADAAASGATGGVPGGERPLYIVRAVNVSAAAMEASVAAVTGVTPVTAVSSHNKSPATAAGGDSATTTSGVVAATSGGSGSRGGAPRVAVLSAPHAIAKGTTPGAGPAAANTVPESLSPGVSPGVGPHDPPPPPPMDGGMEAMSLGPALETTMIQSAQLTCAVLRDERHATELVTHLKSACENALTETIVRAYPATCTVVLKGVPLSIKQDRLWQEVSGLLSAVPSYLRFHRNDRGLFKNVVYLKFASPIDAELGKQELERFSVGGRPLKVELKKPRTTTAEETQRAEAARREDFKVAMTSALDNLIAELLKSTTNEGFSLPKTALSKDDTRYLKGLCQAHDFTFDVGGMTNVTVKKRIAKSVSPSMGPARTPPFHPATPSTHAADLNDAAGLQFRGIRHWREARTAGLSGGTSANGVPLGLHRCLGPADTTTPWSPGRGRPFAHGSGSGSPPPAAS